MDGIDVVELLDGNLDLGLGGAALNNEDEGVVVLDLLHGSLCAPISGAIIDLKSHKPVVKGFWIRAYWSRAVWRTTALRGYRGLRVRARVLGLQSCKVSSSVFLFRITLTYRLKCTLVRILRAPLPWAPATAAFLAAGLEAGLEAGLAAGLAPVVFLAGAIDLPIPV